MLGNARGCEYESRQGHERARASAPTRSWCRESRDYPAPAEVASGTQETSAVRSGRISTPSEAGEAVGITTPTSGDPAFVAVMMLNHYIITATPSEGFPSGCITSQREMRWSGPLCPLLFAPIQHCPPLQLFRGGIWSLAPLPAEAAA